MSEDMPSLADSVVLFFLALVLLGPKKLPALARELGKWIGEFRRASNEFKMQMEEELRLAEQEDRNKKIAAMEAAAPVPPAIAPASEISEPEHPHLPSPEPAADTTEAGVPHLASGDVGSQDAGTPSSTRETEQGGVDAAQTPTPLPIATEGDLSIMPPSTGLPTPRTRAAVSSAFDNIPSAESSPAAPHESETAAHG
jgi:sec-independent protein translocase protein TatB